MKTRKATIIALSLIVIGIVVCIVSFGFGFGFGNSNKDYETESFVKKFENNTGNEDMNINNFSVENIVFDIDCGDIKIVKGDSFKLDVKDAIVDTVTHSVNNKTLTVTQHNPKKLNGNFNFSLFGHSITNNNINTVFTLTVPKGTKFNNIDFRTNVGDISAYEITCDSFSCNVDVCDVRIDNLTCKKTKIDSDVSNVIIKNANISDCNITSDVGDINIDGIITGKNTISTNVGDLELDLDGNIEDYSFVVDKGIGDAEINNKKVSLFENENAPNTFDISHNIGDVDITIK